MADEFDDSSLLARLNALKPSKVDLDRTQAPAAGLEEADDGDDIARRFLGLRARNATSTTDVKADEANPTEADEVENIEDMLKEFRAKQKVSLADDDDKRIRILLAQAQAGLDEVKEGDAVGDDEGAEAHESHRIDQVGSEKRGDDQHAQSDDERSVDEDAEADEILAQILDEVNLEDFEDAADEKEPLASPQHLQAGEDPPTTALEGLSLPSTPSKEPQAKPQAASDELTLPSAPTSIPAGAKPKSSLKKYSNAEIETWCEICQANAEVRCLGCDGELYCMRCWKEGHTGPDAGYEEKHHRCVQYSRPGRPEAAAA